MKSESELEFYFSYVYIDHFRTMTNVSLPFAHRYEYDYENAIISQNGSTESRLSDAFFYGNKIRFLSAVVGKNGTGKSSLIDFLREVFILLLNDFAAISEQSETRMRHPIPDDLAEYYHIQPETDFLIIFHLGRIDYYLTNISLKVDSQTDNLLPWNKDCVRFISDRWNYAYFSMTRDRGGVRDFEANLGRGEKNLDRIGKMLEQHQIDLSEETINLERDESDLLTVGWGKWVNFDLLFQLVFICEQEKYIKEKIGKEVIDNLEICCSNIGIFDKIPLIACITGLKNNGQFDFNILRDQRAYIRPFSSGQYSRFVFMSRLYWCFAGNRSFNTNKKTYGMLKEFLDAKGTIGSTLYQSETLRNPSVLLFDEGDLYYHPEWQRRYVSDIINMANDFACDPVQIIFTTHSPFMLSDLLREDVHVLASNKRELKREYHTFGQNIHMLLAHPFFMEKTIGELAEKRLTSLFSALKKSINDKDEKLIDVICETYEDYLENRGIGKSDIEGINRFVRQLIESVGEDVYRRQLLYYHELYQQIFTIGYSAISEQKVTEKLMHTALELGEIFDEKMLRKEEADAVHLVIGLLERKAKRDR